MNMESRRAIVDKNINRLEKVVLAGSEENTALLTQLRKVREDIITTAKKDYVLTQSLVMKTFKELMERLASLSFYASEADEDTRSIEKAISQLNKIKATISADILGLSAEKEKKEGEQTAEENAEKEPTSEKVESSAQKDVKDYIEEANGQYFDNYEAWYNAVMERDLKINISRNTVEANNDKEENLGNFNLDDMEGCLFNTTEDFDRAFKECDDEDEDEDEDAIEESDEGSEE